MFLFWCISFFLVKNITHVSHFCHFCIELYNLTFLFLVKLVDIFYCSFGMNHDFGFAALRVDAAPLYVPFCPVAVDEFITLSLHGKLSHYNLNAIPKHVRLPMEISHRKDNSHTLHTPPPPLPMAIFRFTKMWIEKKKSKLYKTPRERQGNSV